MWSKSPYAPKVQTAPRAEDVGTQGGLGTAVFLASRVTAPAPGGGAHDASKMLALAELGEVRRGRSQMLANEADRMEEIRRANMVSKIGGKTEEAVLAAISAVTRAPRLVENAIKALFPQSAAAAAAKSDDAARMLEQQCKCVSHRTATTRGARRHRAHRIAMASTSSSQTPARAWFSVRWAALPPSSRHALSSNYSTCGQISPAH